MQRGAALGPPSFVDLNVLPEELRPFRQPSWYVLGLALTLLLGLILVPLYAARNAGSADSARLNAELTLMKSELARSELDFGKARAARQQLDVTEDAIARLAEERQAILGNSRDFSADLDAVTRALPPGTHLDSITGGDGQLTVVGRAAGPTDVLGYYKALADSGRFSQARITSMVITGGQAGGEVTFTIEVTQ